MGRVSIISPRGLWYLMTSIATNGANLSTITTVAAKLYGAQSAFDGRVSYGELGDMVERCAAALHNLGIKAGQRVAVASANSVESVVVIFALGRLGVNIYLVDGRMDDAQLQVLSDRHHFDQIVNPSKVDFKNVEPIKLPRAGFNRLTVLTSGSTGVSKAASRKTGVGTFLPAFVSLFFKLKLWRYRRVFIATPLHHGFGIATLCTTVAMGDDSYMSAKFDADQVCDSILSNQIEAITLVPTMLGRMLDIGSGRLQSLKCIISGGAPLPATLVERTQKEVGQVLFNLYGTSEGGVAIACTPSDLALHPSSIGKPLSGVKVRLSAGNEIEVRSRWAVGGAWTPTGDAGYTKNGYWFLMGRLDDMVVCGGENVYPIELEDILQTNQNVAEVAVVGIEDSDFGQRLCAFVVLRDGAAMDENTINQWLSGRVARHIMPACVVVKESLPYNGAGKIDKGALRCEKF